MAVLSSEWVVPDVPGKTLVERHVGGYLNPKVETVEAVFFSQISLLASELVPEIGSFVIEDDLVLLLADP